MANARMRDLVAKHMPEITEIGDYRPELLYEIKKHKENGWQALKNIPLRKITADVIPEELKLKRPVIPDKLSSIDDDMESAPRDGAAPVRSTARRRRVLLPWQLEGGEWLQSGTEWQQHCMPLLEGAFHQLAPAIDSSVLLRNSPTACLAAVLEAAACVPGDKPLPIGPFESKGQQVARAEAQQHTSSYILPRSTSEREEDFKLRLNVFKPAAQGPRSRKKKAIPLVFPLQPNESPNDFEQRMKLQAHTTFIVLPRGPGEQKSDFDARLEAIKDVTAQWAMHGCQNVSPPLVLPRGRNETFAAFTKRLDQACEPPDTPESARSFCTVILPQAQGEDEAQFEVRLRSQAGVSETIVPFNAKLELQEEFSARLEEAEARLNESARSSRSSTTEG